MNNETAFLNCNIWSVHSINQPYIDQNLFLVSAIYHYNSLTSGIHNFNPECIQVPEFDIKEIHLLEGLNYDFITKQNIPILSRIDNSWKIDLTLYHKLINEYEKNTSM